jgi:hypothetical protein
MIAKANALVELQSASGALKGVLCKAVVTFGAGSQSALTLSLT